MTEAEYAALLAEFWCEPYNEKTVALAKLEKLHEAVESVFAPLPSADSSDILCRLD